MAEIATLYAVPPKAQTPPLASVGVELLQSPPQTADTAVPGEETLEEAVRVIEKEIPLELDEPPLVAENVSVVAAGVEALPSQPPSAGATRAADMPALQEHDSLKVEEKEIAKSEKLKSVLERKLAPESMVSFKEESNKLSDLSDFERRALEELGVLVQEALNNRIFESASSSETAGFPEEVSIWGVPLMSDERSNVILLKFLRAREFKVKESFTMLKNTINWRREFKIDELVKEDLELGDALEKVVFMHGHDKDGHPVCYNVYGEFKNKDLYAMTFSDEEKRLKFLRWRIQFLERSIRKLDFSPGGINTIFQVTDLKNSPGPTKRELRIATRQALQILQDNYPEFVAKQVVINVPWWHLAFHMMISPFLTQRTKSKLVFTSPARTAETLFKYISPEQVPTQYGGLSVDICECNPEFTPDDPATEITVNPSTKKTVEIIVNEKCSLIWELRVVGWEVSYGAEFTPRDEHGYTVIIQKTRKMAPTGEPVVANRFNVGELGKVLLIIDNPGTKKKKLIYRFKVIPYLG